MEIKVSLPRQATLDDVVALDIEIFNADQERLHTETGDFACLSICFAGEDVVYQIQDKKQMKAVVKLLSPAKYWVFHNAQFDLRQMRRWATIKPRPVWDTMLVDQAMFGGYYTTYSLADLCIRWLKLKLSKVEQSEFFSASVMSPRLERYAAMDASVTVKIQQLQEKYLADEMESLDTYFLVDMPTIWAVLDMQPVRVDMVKWQELAEKFDALKEEMKSNLDFNPASAKQAKARLEALYHKPVEGTGAEVLDDLADIAEAKGNIELGSLIDTIRTYREYATASSRYGMGWMIKNCTEDGYVFSSWHISGAESGRMSSSKPNLQNIPARKHPEYRTAFVASKGNILLVSDVASQEPRVLAHLSKDEKLIEILNSGESIHLYVTRELFNNPNITKKSPEYAIGKALNLGIEYGMTPRGLAYRIHISEDDAAKYFKHYFELFPGIQNFINRYRRDASRLGHVRTPLGRKLHVNPYNNQWQNNAINSPVQGGAAEMTKLALTYMHQQHEAYGVPYTVVMVIHDEIVCDVPVEHLDATTRLMLDAWDYAGKTTIPTMPVVVEYASGNNWGCKGE